MCQINRSVCGLLKKKASFGVVSDLDRQRQDPPCPNCLGSSFTMMVLRSFPSRGPRFFVSYPPVSRPWCSLLGVSILYHTPNRLYIDMVHRLMVQNLFDCCLERAGNLCYDVNVGVYKAPPALG